MSGPIFPKWLGILYLIWYYLCKMSKYAVIVGIVVGVVLFLKKVGVI